jgi:AcrR family transcriptional regulator|tara:strand:+ start:4592 stop:5245 length:654 start_codon:yes stop_codon:yes gene_type:complete
MTNSASRSPRKTVTSSKVKIRSAQSAETVTDGRINRSVVTRLKIVKALSDLICDGFLSPTAEQVAARADVGLRTVFRQFADMENLYREITPQINKLVLPLLAAPLAGNNWKSRLNESILIRATLYERLAAFQLASQAMRHQSVYLSDQLMSSAALHRRALEQLLPPAMLDNPVALEALDLTTSIDVWIRLRREQGLSVDKALKVMQCIVAGVIAGTE